MRRIFLIISAALLFALPIYNATAHCDSETGPVIQDAKKSLEDGNINRVLKWVDKKDEDEIIDAFKVALENRKTNMEKADREFFELLVKLHRESEDAEYNGINDGSDVPKPLKLIDTSLEKNSESAVINKISEQINKVLTEKYNALLAAKAHDVNDVEAGREYVQKYVEFMHLVENLHNTMSHADGHHNASAEKTSCCEKKANAEKKCGGHK